MSFADVRNSIDPQGMVQNSAQSDNKDGIFKIVKGLTLPKKKKELNDQRGFYDSDESSLFDSDSSTENKSTATSEDSNKEMGSGIELGSPPSSETYFNSASIVGFFPWKKRRLSFGLSRRKREPLIEKTFAVHDKAETNLVDLDKCGSVQVYNFLFLFYFWFSFKHHV